MDELKEAVDKVMLGERLDRRPGGRNCCAWRCTRAATP